MTDTMDETGKGPSRPGEVPKRPYATIDVHGAEIGRERGQPAQAPARAAWAQWLSAAWTMLASWLAVARAGLRQLARRHDFLSHAGAGVAGAVLTLAAAWLLGLLAAYQGSESVPSDLADRLAAVERTLAQRPALPESVTARLAVADQRLAKLEDRVQGALVKAAADTQALEARTAGTDMTERIAKLEAALAALPADDKSAGARLADAEKLAGAASEAKAASVRSEHELAALKSEGARLRQGMDALKGAVDERLKDAAKAGDLATVLARLAAFERDLGGVQKTEGERVANAQQVLLALELANLKRTLDRGDSYTRELDAVRAAAAGSVDLAALDRSSRAGVAALGTLTQQFRQVANAAMDAETERPDASVLDRLMAGARSIVRLRKASHEPDDVSAEATLARMESALKDGRIGEVLAQGKRLPPKAALAAEDWLRKLEARYAADRAIADIETALKTSLGAQRAAVPEATR
jgi:hypothetical protein